MSPECSRGGAVSCYEEVRTALGNLSQKRKKMARASALRVPAVPAVPVVPVVPAYNRRSSISKPAGCGVPPRLQLAVFLNKPRRSLEHDLRDLFRSGGVSRCVSQPALQKLQRQQGRPYAVSRAVLRDISRETGFLCGPGVAVEESRRSGRPRMATSELSNIRFRAGRGLHAC